MCSLHALLQSSSDCLPCFFFAGLWHCLQGDATEVIGLLLLLSGWEILLCFFLTGM